MPENKGRKCGTRKRKGSANKKPTEGMPVVSSRVTQWQPHQTNQLVTQQTEQPQPASFQPRITPTNVNFQIGQTPTNVTCQLGFTPTNVTFPRAFLPTNDACQPGLAPMNAIRQPGFIPPYITQHSPPVDPINQAHVSPLATYVANQRSPARQKPDAGSFAFARLPYLDSRVSRCYGCGELLKPGGVMPSPPNDLVLTTRLHRKYYKDGQLQRSPTISSIYLHVSSYCARAALPEFTPALCHLPNDLIPFLHEEHYKFMLAKLGINFVRR